MSRLQRAEARTAAALYRIANGCLELLRLCLWPRRRPSTAKRVCVYRIGNIGDSVCAVPAIFAVRCAYPDAHLTLLTSPVSHGLPGAKELLASAPWLDEILVYYNDEVDTLPKRLRLLRILRERRFDVWIELPSELFSVATLVRNMLAARLVGSKYGCGWRVNRIRFALRAQATQLKFPNEVARLLDITQHAGIRPAGLVYPLPRSLADVARIDRLLGARQSRGAGMIAIAPGAKRQPNRWPVNRFAAVGRFAVSRGFTIAAIGGAADSELCEQLVEQIGEAVVNLAGRTSLGECCEVLRRCFLLVSNDSGVQHLAAAVGLACISLFSCRDIKGKWWPCGPENIIIQKTVDCHTCYLDTCPYDNRCINEITTLEVIAAVERKIATRASALHVARAENG